MPAITAVFTLAAVAQTLGLSEDLLHDLLIEMEPEDGCIAVYGPGLRQQPDCSHGCYANALGRADDYIWCRPRFERSAASFQVSFAERGASARTKAMLRAMSLGSRSASSLSFASMALFSALV